MKEYRSIRRALFPLRRTLLHPQWFAYREEAEGLAWIGGKAKGVVLDIGCADGRVKEYLGPACTYVGLDYYPTAVTWYNSQPGIFGDARDLPVKNTCIDTALMLDVLEHLPQPLACIAEVERILKPGAGFFLRVPFIYPLHDEPYDFQRWTIHGLREMLGRHNFVIEDVRSYGDPIETAALMANIAVSKTALNWIRRRNPLAVLSLLLPVSVVLLNTAAWLLTLAGSRDGMMPHSYMIYCRKNP
jgi:SAM-dependent methyltransferase